MTELVVQPTPSISIDCRSYREHQLEHRLVDGRWLCPPCQAPAVPPVNPADPLEFVVLEHEVQAASLIRQWRRWKRDGFL